MNGLPDRVSVNSNQLIKNFKNSWKISNYVISVKDTQVLFGLFFQVFLCLKFFKIKKIRKPSFPRCSCCHLTISLCVPVPFPFPFFPCLLIFLHLRSKKGISRQASCTLFFEVLWPSSTQAPGVPRAFQMIAVKVMKISFISEYKEIKQFTNIAWWKVFPTLSYIKRNVLIFWDKVKIETNFQLISPILFCTVYRPKPSWDYRHLGQTVPSEEFLCTSAGPFSCFPCPLTKEKPNSERLSAARLKLCGPVATQFWSEDLAPLEVLCREGTNHPQYRTHWQLLCKQPLCLNLRK